MFITDIKSIYNAYFAGLKSEGNIALQKDMAVMMVPSDDAMNRYFHGENPESPSRGKAHPHRR